MCAVYNEILSRFLCSLHAVCVVRNMCVENWIWNAIEYRIYLHDENNQTGNDITIRAASPHNSNWFFVSKDEWIYQCLLTLSYHFNVRLISTDNIVWLWFFRRHFYYCKYLRRAFEELNKKSFVFFLLFLCSYVCFGILYCVQMNEPQKHVINFDMI